MPSPSDDLLARLSRLHPKVIDLSLGRIERLLHRLGRPQDRLPPVVHVAGTNGKGSLVAFLRAMLEADGRRVHVYTSPHLVRFHERIVVAGQEISEAALARVLDDCERVNAGEPITFFEITTAAAFVAFTEAAADVTLLETGLGGRLDATNVVARPALTALTPISLDHQSFLGNTIAAIAGEKVGILKPGVVCISAQQRPEALAVIRARAAALGVPLAVQGEDWRIEDEDAAGGFAVCEESVRTLLPSPALPGAHQRQNGALAVVCAHRLGALAPSPAAIARGLRQVRWPARLQRLVRGPLVDRLPAGWELWLDGGHNPGAAEVLARQFRAWADRPLHLVVGMLRSKDAAGFLAPLAHAAATVRTITVPEEPASFSADELAVIAAASGLEAVPVDGLAAACAFNEGVPARVLICGSLYLAGRVLADNG